MQNLALVEELDTPSGRGLANCDKMSAGPREAGRHAATAQQECALALVRGGELAGAGEREGEGGNTDGPG